MSRLSNLIEGLSYTITEEGFVNVLPKARRIVGGKVRERLTCLDATREKHDNSYVDVMFINGCHPSVPHPIRYRVEHQAEQLRAAGMSVTIVDAWNLKRDHLRHARTFIIFRCPITDEIESFIREARKLNKRVIYDIDDLVIDTAYTNQIPYVKAMSADEKVGYDDGVDRMGATLRLCDCAITTTEALATELKKFVPRVYINRNTASELMLSYSEIALRRRDVLPGLKPDAVARTERKAYRRALARRVAVEATGEVRIGFFSGSITHNADFEMVLPAIVRLMDNYPQVTLLLFGELDPAGELARFGERIVVRPFCEWRRLPNYIASCDINIAPLEDTLFNRAKSENKWVEAALVKVPTVASRVGAFEEMIEDGVTGILCKSVDEWYDALERLVLSKDERFCIAEAAYKHCKSACTTVGNAANIADIIRREQTENVVFVMPSLKTSGGVLVIIRHAAMLQDAGYDVMFANTDDEYEWLDRLGHTFPVLNRVVPSGMIEKCPFLASIDVGVATLWDTLDFLKRYPRIRRRLYLVQNHETGFLPVGNPLRSVANSTYLEPYGVEYLTISEWCRHWLKNAYGQDCRFAPNGIDAAAFPVIERDFSSSKIRILIEGDCNSEYKNVDESFRIVDKLDKSRFEIWYMNYTGATKPFYHIDKNVGAVPHDQVADVYRACHILLKTSILESFSYPPLEMMATGGFVIACPNGGNEEYLVDAVNCLLYPQGDIDAAAMAIERIVSDAGLRAALAEGGRKTVAARDWSALVESVVGLYR